MVSVKAHTDNPEVLAALAGFRPAGELGDGSLWSYKTGVKKINRIRVYERSPGGSLYYEYYDNNGRHQQPLADVTGETITDRALAMYLADQMAEGQARKRNAESGRRFLGLPDRRTLEQLFDRYHADHPDWSAGHERNQNAHRRFWLRHLGADTLLQDVNVAAAVRAVREELGETGGEGFGPRTRKHRMRYIQDAYNYAVKYLKWLDPQDDLAALDKYIRQLSSPRSRKVYTPEEGAKLLAAAPDVDLRAAAFGWIAATTGRRPKSIHALTPEDYTTEDGYGVLHFKAEHDKVGQEGRMYINGPAKVLVEHLLEQPAVQAAGTLWPRGELDDPTASDRLSDEWMRTLWEQVEEAAGVKHHTGRSYYGLKRIFATRARNLDPQAASQAAGVTQATMERHYEQQNEEAKKALADHMAKIAPVHLPAIGRKQPETQEQGR